MVDQDRGALALADLQGVDHEVAERFFVRADFHAAPAEDEGGADEDGISDLAGDPDGLIERSGDAAGGACEVELGEQQFYVNGKHVGRYFVATADGKAVPPQSRYVIPGPWLHAGRNNDLVIFEEHGANPGRCRVLYEEGPAPIRA